MINLLLTFLGKVVSDVLKIFILEMRKPQKSKTAPALFEPEKLGVEVRLNRLLNRYGRLPGSEKPRDN